MTKKRLLQIVLSILAIFSLATCALLFCATWLEQTFRTSSNQEIATLVGNLSLSHPELDFSAAIHALQTGNSEESVTVIGTRILQDYGINDDLFASHAAAQFSVRLTFSVCLVLAVASVSLIVYFWISASRRDRQISQLVTYLQQLGDQIYDLRIDQNREGELSLLTNELYKIVVALKSAAEQNHLRSQNLESALADISHQIRTPLTSLQVMVDNINDDPDMPTAVRADFLHSISEQIDNMSGLVTTLLNLAKFDNDSIILQNQPTRVSELFDAVIGRLSALADLENIKLITSGDLDAEISLDQRWQTEALVNLVKNCLEHSSSGSQVILNAEDCPLFLRITIQDFGEGIAPGDLRHIFERFYKAKNATSESVGIGLSFAKAIIESGHGQIKVKSTLGEGTSFIVTYFK